MTRIFMMLFLSAAATAIAIDNACASTLEKEHSSGLQTMVLADRFEYQSNKGDPLLIWDADLWAGYDINKVRIKTEGAYDFDADAFDDAEIQGLWSRAVSRFWDLQLGVRHDFEPGSARSFAVIGMQGLAPYWFEVDSALFISTDGDVEARVELEYDLLVTQRLILQPRAELNAAFQSTEDHGVGSGLSEVELGLRMRYEIRREIAPYLGVSWTRNLGKTADFARRAGEQVGGVSFVAGIRIWF